MAAVQIETMANEMRRILCWMSPPIKKFLEALPSSPTDEIHGATDDTDNADLIPSKTAADDADDAEPTPSKTAADDVDDADCFSKSGEAAHQIEMSAPHSRGF